MANPSTSLVDNDKIHALQQRLGYQFNQSELLINALTHRSHRNLSNERLEYLGDSILGFLIALELFNTMPNATEGALTRARSNLVCGQMLVELADQLQLHNALILGNAERRKGEVASSILENAFEALIAAVYLDGGMQATQNVVLRIYGQRIADFEEQLTKANPKSLLQERLQQDNIPLPEYQMIESSGPPHKPHFVVTCTIDNKCKPFYGSGNSRRIAEQNAAIAALEFLTTNG